LRTIEYQLLLQWFSFSFFKFLGAMSSFTSWLFQ